MNERFLKAHITYNYCCICGHIPKTRNDEPNRAPLRYWDPDDGWIVGSLCRACADEALDRQPKEGDFATEDMHDERTDEDPGEAL